MTRLAPGRPWHFQLRVTLWRGWFWALQRWYTRPRPVSRKPEWAWKWRKWTFGFWTDPENCTYFGLDIGPLEIVWRLPGYRP